MGLQVLCQFHRAAALLLEVMKDVWILTVGVGRGANILVETHLGAPIHN